MIKIIDGGMLTTVQDGGRHGFQRFGVPVSGAMDSLSLALANILVGNSQAEAALEFTLIGCTIEFTEREIFAVCGGDFETTLAGAAIEMNRAYLAEAGDILAIGTAKHGARGYLAFAGGLQIQPVMGSRSTYLKGGFGGFMGRRLLAGDALELRAPQPFMLNLAKRKIERKPQCSGTKVLRVLLGTQADLFSPCGLHTFFAREYKIEADSDRMGYRTLGASIEFKHAANGNIISDGVAMGSIQVPSGTPLIMMADRQTTGGYAKIANVISADLPTAAQCKPGDYIAFQQVSINDAQTQTRKLHRLIQDAEDEVQGL